MNKGSLVILVAVGAGIIYLLTRNAGTIEPSPPLTSWESRIAGATSHSQLDEIRFGKNGYETLYFAYVIDYDEYLRIHSIWLARYYEL